jgi:hypothetical protein
MTANLLWADLIPAVCAAADNDLYRIAGSIPSEWRTRNGDPIDPDAVRVAIAGGLLGQFQARETLPDGVLAERMDLSEHGLDWHLQQTA